MSQFAEHIGACRCDYYDICFLCDRYMLYLELEIPVKGIYQAFIASNRWQQYLKGVIPTLYVTAIALTIGVVLGSVVALVRVAHDQQRRGHHDPALAVANAVCKLYATVIRGTPMMVQMLIMSMVIFANSRNFTMVGALALGINSGA